MKLNRMKRGIAVLAIAGMMMGGMAAVVSADPAPDGKTIASQTPAAKNGAFTSWEKKWKTLQTDWTQVSLSPGRNDTEMNFAWYSKNTTGKLVISKNKDMSKPLQTVKIKGERGVEAKDQGTYYSCKAVAKNLKKGESYYYQADKKTPVKFTVQDSSKGFQFVFVGDPQIGSSNELKGAATKEFYEAQAASVGNDSFNWNNTINRALEKAPKASFILSSGDQIQTTLRKAPDKDPANSEIEYAGYLSPDALKSLPVATTVGNHDSDNPNYLYHFNIANISKLGSNGVVGGDYYYTYGDALFIMLNTQDTNIAEHKKFIEQTVKANSNKKWRIVTLHQDIYGSAEHSNEPEITNLRYSLVPIFEDNKIDVVLTGHDHAYSRTQILKGGKKATDYTDDEFDAALERDVDAGDNPKSRFTAPGNIKSDSSNKEDQAYLDYLNAVMDKEAVADSSNSSEMVVDPDGILYITAGSSSGSKYYDLVPRKQSYIANRWQEDVPSYSIIDIKKDTLTINTYRTDNGKKIDNTFTIRKTK